jgi:hypothetical protein
MKKTIFFAFCLLFCAGILHAQDKKGILAIGLGGSVNYYYGPTDRNFNSFEMDRVSGQADGMLALRLRRNNGGNGTLLGVFGTFGLMNRTTLNQMLLDQGYVSTLVNNQSRTNSFYRLEGGVVLGEILRLSTGVGEQMFDEQTLTSGGNVMLNATSLKYYSSTAGFMFNISNVSLLFNVNFAYGKDYDQTVVTPSVGLLFGL